MLDLTDWEKKKYQTRGGDPVRILCIDGPGDYPIVGVWVNRKGSCIIPPTWAVDGDYLLGSNAVKKEDLINAKTKKEGWVQVNSKIVGVGRVANTTHVHPTPEKAMENGWGPAYPCVKIEWEE